MWRIASPLRHFKTTTVATIGETVLCARTIKKVFVYDKRSVSALISTKYNENYASNDASNTIKA